jgi:hypothetical protein
MTPYLTSALLGILIAGGILLLVRRDHLHGGFAVWWLAMAAAALVLGLVPGSVDWLGRAFGVAYPPMLVAVLGLCALLLKLLVLDIDVTRRERRVRRLLQKVAILEAEMRDMRAELDALQDARQPRSPAAPVTPLPAARADEARRAAG